MIQTIKMVKLTLSILFVLCNLYAIAQTYNIDCVNSTTQSEMNLCAKAAYLKSDSTLNINYQKILSALDNNIQIVSKPKPLDTAQITYCETLKANIIAAQKVWAQFRDVNANAEKYIYNNGSMSPMIYFQSLEYQTKLRIDYLKKLYKDLFED